MAGGDCLKVVKNIKALKALQDDWDDLCTRSNSRFSQSFVWCWTTWDAVHGPRKRRLHCIVARNGTRLVLIWPFVVYPKNLRSVAAPMGCAYGEYPDPLVEDGPEASRRIEAAWRILRDTCRCDIIRLRHVREGSELQRLMVSGKAKIVEKVANLKVKWDDYDSWESYYSSIKGDDRRNIERRRRQLDELGNVSFEIIEGPQCAPAIDWALASKVKQLERTNRRGGGWLRTKAYRNLLVWAAARGGPQGRVIMFALKLDDQIIATQLCRVDETHVEALNSVYDEAYSRYGPGKILKGECLKWAFERQLEFDMRTVDFPHKRRWTNRECLAITYEVPNSVPYAICRWVPALTPLIHGYRWGQLRIDRYLRHRLRSGRVRRTRSA